MTTNAFRHGSKNAPHRPTVCKPPPPPPPQQNVILRFDHVHYTSHKAQLYVYYDITCNPSQTWSLENEGPGVWSGGVLAGMGSASGTYRADYDDAQGLLDWTAHGEIEGVLFAQTNGTIDTH